MASSNAHRVLERSLRSDPVRPRTMRTPDIVGSEMLEMINERAMNHAHALSQKKQNPHLHHAHHVDRMLQGMSPEDAREFAFQAREQISFLDGVNTRVEKAMENSKDLFASEDAKLNQSDPKTWVEESRRLLNRKMFLYNESCEERQKELSSFCDWFEVYQNIWPLPLVGNEAQYSSFLGNPAKEMDWTEESKMQEMWPKISKMKEDLSHIMSVTSEMGQKALGLEVRKEMKRLNIVIRDCQNQIEEGKKKLEHEKKTILAKEAELVKNRHMHDTALNSRNEVIKMLTEEKNKLVENAKVATMQHRQELEDLHISYRASLAQCQAEIKELKRDHEVQRKEIAELFEAKIKECDEKINSLNLQVSDLQSSVQNGQLELKSKNDEVTFLTNRLTESNEAVEKMKADILRLQNELRAEKANPYVKQVEKERDDLAARSVALQALVEKLEGTLVVIKKNSDSATLLLAARDEEIGTLKTRLQDSSIELQKSTTKYEALCVSFERQTSEILNHLKEMAGMKENVAVLEKELKAANVKSAKVAEEAAFLGAMAENLKSELDEQTAKNSKLLSYVSTLQVERVQERERFKKEMDDLTTRNAAELALLDAEVKDLREYQASRLSVRFSQVETQTAESSESQESELSEFEAAASRRMTKRLSGLREKVNNIRVMFEKEVSALKGNVKTAINFNEHSNGAVDRQNHDAPSETQAEIKDLNKFVELSVTTLSELEHVLEGVDAYLCMPFNPDGSIEDHTNPSVNMSKQDGSNLLPPTLKKMDLHVVENNFDFSRIHRLQPLPSLPNDIRLVGKNLQPELPIPIETALLLRNESNKNLDPRQFYAAYASPMKTPENSLMALQPARPVNSSGFVGGNADLVPFTTISSNEITKESAGVGRHLLAPNPSLPFPDVISSHGSASLDEMDSVKLGASVTSNIPNITQGSAYQSQLAASDSFRSTYNRKERFQLKGSNQLVNTSKSTDQNLGKVVTQSPISTPGLNRVNSESKEFEVLETSDVFAKSDMFSEDMLSAQYSPGSSKDRSSSASGMRTGNASRMSNNSTRPSSRAQDTVLRNSPPIRGADFFPMPLSRSNSGADMLTSYHYLSNVSPWDGYTETKNDSVSTSTVPDVKGPYHEVASSESCFHGFKPSRMLKVLQESDGEINQRGLEAGLHPGPARIEVMNVLHPSDTLPTLQPTNKFRKAEGVKIRPDGSMPNAIPHGQGLGTAGSAAAWLQVQGVRQSSKKQLLALIT